MSVERRLVDVKGPHPDLVVSQPQVELGEEMSTMELVEQLIDNGDQKHVLDGERVQSIVVDAKAPRAICFLDEDDRRGESQVTVADNLLLDHGQALVLQLVLVCCWVPVGTDHDGLRAWLEDDVVVVGALRRQTAWLGEDVSEPCEQLVK